MNKKQIFENMAEGKGHGFIRKGVKGAVSGIALAGTLILASHTTVSADEQTSAEVTSTNAENVASTSDIMTTDAVANTVEKTTDTTVNNEQASQEDAPESSDVTTINEVTPTEEAASDSNVTPTDPVSAPTENTQVQGEELDDSAEVATDAQKSDVVVNSDELAKAIDEAKKAGVSIRQTAPENKGVANTPEEAEKLEKSIQEYYANLIKELREKTAEAKANQEKTAEALAEIDAHKNDEGYLSKTETQNLIFQSEPDAKHTVSKAPATAEELAKVEKGMRPETVAVLNNSTNKQYIISTGESISVTYTNLKNSSLDGVKIDKVVYTYKLNHSGYGNSIVLGFCDDPTLTLWYLNGDKDTSINMDVKFYDSKGNLINPDGCLVSFASLNRGGSADDWEGVSDFSGEFIKINGSSVSVQSNGVARSMESNSYKSLGSKYDVSEWDVDGSPLEYYGAIVGKSNGKINFNIRSTGRGYVWFAFNSNIKAPVLVVTDPTVNYNLESYTLEDIVTKDTSKTYGNVIVHYIDRTGKTILPDVTDTDKTVVSTTVTTHSSLNGTSSETTPSGARYDTTDHKPKEITLENGRVYRIAELLTKGEETGAVVEGTTEVTYVYNEIEGSVVVHYVDTEGNTIKKKVTDTPRTSLGVDYDTRDNKPKEIEYEGHVYRIDENLTDGQETGKVVEGETDVTYVYNLVRGDVIVHYVDTEGNTIATDVIDTDQAPVNDAYDTTDHKPTEIEYDGHIYRIDKLLTVGKEKGKVTEDPTEVTYVYHLVTGDVIVHYVDENGNTIASDVIDESDKPVNDAYDTTDHKPTSIYKHGKVYNIIPASTQGSEKGKVVEGITNVTYVYKLVEASPEKTSYLSDGTVANDKTVLANSELDYVITIDNSHYQGIKSNLTAEDQQVGLTVIEDLDEAHITADLQSSRVLLKGSNTPANGFYVTYYGNVSEAPKAVQEAVAKVEAETGKKVVGGFVAFTSYDPNASLSEQANQNLIYTKTYLNMGQSLDVKLVATVNRDVNATDIDNTAYQVDFSGAKATNTVVNHTPAMNPQKDIVATVSDGLQDKNSLNGQEVTVGDTYDFELQGSHFSNLAQGLDSYSFKDSFSNLVSYDGVNSWYAMVDITLSDGTVITKGTDISQYVTQTITYNEDGTTSVVYEFNKDFLGQVDWTKDFQVVGYAQVKQLEAGTVENIFDEIVNGAVYSSNKVSVTAVNPEEPVQPTEANPAVPSVAEAPVVKASALPATGDSDMQEAELIGLALLAMSAGMAYVERKKKRA